MQLDNLYVDLEDKIFADKGYISKNIFTNLSQRVLRLFTNLKKSEKYLLEMDDKINLRKRALAESVFNVLKNKMSLGHTRNRSSINLIVHILASITFLFLSS